VQTLEILARLIHPEAFAREPDLSQRMANESSPQHTDAAGLMR
jgi:hypothetical protein